MSQDEIRSAIEGAIDYLTKHPDEAKYTDSPATARLTEPAGGLKVEVTGPDGARMSTDMPTSVGGTNTTASPGWYLRAAEASAVATLIGMRAAQLGVPLTEVEVTVDSLSDDWGILGITDLTGEGVPAGPLSTRVAVRVRSRDQDVAKLEELVRWSVDHSPPVDAVRRAVPVEVEISAGD
jgi:uncharacterized OsmC-like protein